MFSVSARTTSDQVNNVKCGFRTIDGKGDVRAIDNIVGVSPTDGHCGVLSDTLRQGWFCEAVEESKRAERQVLTYRISVEPVTSRVSTFETPPRLPH